jgi:sugar phosphate isomerase/epimerase
MMPFANIHTLDDTIRLVVEAGRRNGGVILDLWHVVRMNIPYPELGRIPKQYLMGVELNDGGLVVKGDLHQATVDNRKLCGDGEFDVKGFIRCLRDLGYRGPWGIEVLNKEIREWPLEKIVERSWTTTAAEFRAVGLMA